MKSDVQYVIDFVYFKLLLFLEEYEINFTLFIKHNVNS